MSEIAFLSNPQGDIGLKCEKLMTYFVHFDRITQKALRHQKPLAGDWMKRITVMMLKTSPPDDFGPDE
jgi:hypothetical protein